ncbi:Clavaminate synthase-like protein [Neoconidiobolus thromboides FSU 785]|nr:Clavaminate synthase-like protein [Neoconidiobolus thromboides FSU 785]
MLVLDLNNSLSTDGIKKEKDYQDKKNEIINALSTLGFFYAQNHGIEEKEIKQLFKIAKQFFNEKEEIKNKYPFTGNEGYSRLGQERLSKKYQLDYKEAFNLPSNFKQLEHPLPEIFENDKAFLDTFTKKCNQTCQTILREIALSLDLDKDYFIKAHQYEDKSGSIMRILHYPPLSKDIDRNTITRAGSHSDYGTLTLLFQEDSEIGEENSGLQVLKDQNSDEWLDVPYKKGSIIVNVADLLSIWTEGRLRSAKHRVVLPENSKLDTNR